MIPAKGLPTPFYRRGNRSSEVKGRTKSWTKGARREVSWLRALAFFFSIKCQARVKKALIKAAMGCDDGGGA